MRGKPRDPLGQNSGIDYGVASKGYLRNGIGFLQKGTSKTRRGVACSHGFLLGAPKETMGPRQESGARYPSGWYGKSEGEPPISGVPYFGPRFLAGPVQLSTWAHRAPWLNASGLLQAPHEGLRVCPCRGQLTCLLWATDLLTGLNFWVDIKSVFRIEPTKSDSPFAEGQNSSHALTNLRRASSWRDAALESRESPASFPCAHKQRLT